MREDKDYRYRVLVMLKRSDRPKYYNFNCFMCQRKVAELSGVEVKAFDDLADMYIKTTTGVRCTGRGQHGGHCPMWYYFEVAK